MVNVCVLSQDIVDMEVMEVMVEVMEAMEAMEEAMAVIEDSMDGVNDTDMIQKCTYIHNYV